MDSPYRTNGLWRYALLGVAGLMLFGWLFQRYGLAPKLEVKLNRAASVERARTIAQELGWAVADWEARAWSSEPPDQHFYYNANNPAPELKQWLPRLRFNVEFRSPDSPATINVRLNPQGQLLRFNGPQASANDQERRGGRGGGAPPPNRRGGGEPPPPKAEQASPAEAELAEQAVRRYFEAANFSGAPTVTSTRNGFDFTWKKELPNEPRLTLETNVEIAQDLVQLVELTPRFSPAFQSEFAQLNLSKSKLGLIFIPVSALLLLCLALVFVFFDSLNRNEIQQRPALYLLFGSLLLFLTINLLSGYSEVLVVGGAPNPKLATFFRLLGMTMLMGFLSFVLYMAWAAGQSLAARRAGRRTVAFELILTGRFTHSYVARQCFIGLCGGVLFALLPYLVKATLFRSATIGLPNDYEIFSARIPALIVFSEIIVLLVFLIFAFGVPLVEHYLIRRPVAWLVILLLGGLGLADQSHFPYNVAAQLLTGLLTIVLLYWLYRQHDLLTVTVTASAGFALLHAAALAAQPVASLRIHGLAVVFILAIAALAAWFFANRGAALDEKLFEPLNAAITAIERERLKAEIAVAQRAQQQMLPAAPPEIPGLEIAASCQPSKDVGGDLFDFLTLPDGRFGIVVADVSGKGVPAALYMTLTKGVLASVTEYESDPGAILRETNRHLYEACRKKVFVTLFLGVYDPTTRRLTYARAGHNPTVYRSRSRNHTELLKPRGMGLGLAGEKTFNPTLAVASLQLHTDDLLIFYSDGITEAMNNQQEEYGEERLMKLAAREDVTNATFLHNAVLADVKNFLGKVAPQDDQTLVVLRAC